jgi:small-conductance mechanosensitive channel
LPALLVLWWQRGKPRSINQFVGLALVPVGLIAFMLLSWRWAGDLLAPAKAPWGRRLGFFLMPLWDYLRHPEVVALPWNFALLNFAAALLAFVAIYLLIRQKQSALALYVAIMLLLPLSTSTLISLARYMSVCFPIFIALGDTGRSARLDQTIRIVFITLFVLMTALFAARFTMALA